MATNFCASTANSIGRCCKTSRKTVNDQSQCFFFWDPTLLQIEQLVIAHLTCGRLMFNAGAAIASLDIGNCVGTAAVANQQAITLCIVARTRGVRRAFHQASISILAFTGANALTDDAASCVLTDVNHLGSRVCLLAVVGNRNTIEFAT